MIPSKESMLAFILKSSKVYAATSMKVTGNSHWKQSFVLFSGKVVAKQRVAAYKRNWLREKESRGWVVH